MRSWSPAPRPGRLAPCRRSPTRQRRLAQSVAIALKRTLLSGFHARDRRKRSPTGLHGNERAIANSRSAALRDALQHPAADVSADWLALRRAVADRWRRHAALSARARTPEFAATPSPTRAARRARRAPRLAGFLKSTEIIGFTRRARMTCDVW